MKYTLVIIRHAKAEPDTSAISDFDRALTPRGKEDAAAMGQRLAEKEIIPSLIISSAAKRTVQTAKRIARATGYPEDQIRRIDGLYHCTPSTLEHAVSALPADIATCFVVGHNPGVSEFADEILPGQHIFSMPTAAVVAVTFEAPDWQAFPAAKKKLLIFDSPKQ